MEAGYRAAGHRYKQDGEQIPQALIVKARKGRKVHGRMSHHQPQNSPDNHSREHKGGHEIPGLHKHPHRQDRRQKNVGKGQVDPHILSRNQGNAHPQPQGQYRPEQSHRRFLPAGQMKMLLHQAECHGENDKEQGNGTGRTIDPGG